MRKIPKRSLNDCQKKRIYYRSITNNLNIVLDKLIDRSINLLARKSKYNKELKNSIDDKETLRDIANEIQSKEKTFKQLCIIKGRIEPR